MGCVRPGIKPRGDWKSLTTAMSALQPVPVSYLVSGFVPGVVSPNRFAPYKGVSEKPTNLL